MTWIEYAVIAAYLGLLIVVGWIFKRFNENTSDYLRGGCRGSWWLVGTSVFMSLFSAWTFTGAAGVAYESGFSVMVIYFANAAGFFVNFLFTGPWLRQLRATTAPEVINLRFGPGTQKLYAFTLVPMRLLYSSLHLYGLGIFCSAVFGYDIKTVIIVVGIVVLFYSTSGGRWAVMATDFLQGLILVPLTILVAILCLKAMGGFGGLLQAIEVQGLKSDFQVINPTTRFAGAFTWGWASAMMLKQVVTYNTLQAAPRYFSVKDGANARKAALLAMVLMLLGAFFWFVPPMTARLLFSNEVIATSIAKPAEAAYAVASLQVLPSGLTGMIIVAILTATMSSMDTGLNVNAAIMIRDIYPNLCRWWGRQPSPEENQLKYARWITLVLGLIIILLAIYFSQQDGKGIFEIMLDMGALVATPMAVPMFWGMFVRRTPSWIAFGSIGCAVVPSILGFFSGSLFESEWTFQMKFFSVFFTGSGAFLAALPFAGGLSKERAKGVDEFFRRMHTPIDFGKEVGEGNDGSQLTILGRLGLGVGIFVALMVALPNQTAGRLTILALATVISIVSVSMIWIGGQNKARGRS
jgi:SSS family transporter